MKTTLNRIRACLPRTESFEKLFLALGKTKADDEPLSIITILDILGLDAAFWCLRVVEGHDREIRLLGVNYAERVRHLMAGPRSLEALEVSARYANGQATKEELDAARNAAKAAVSAFWAAVRAAEEAVGAAEGAVGAAARNAAEAVWTAAGTDKTAAGTAWTAWTAEVNYQAGELRRFCTCIDKGIDPYPPREERKLCDSENNQRSGEVFETEHDV